MVVRLLAGGIPLDLLLTVSVQGTAPPVGEEGVTPCLCAQLRSRSRPALRRVVRPAELRRFKRTPLLTPRAPAATRPGELTDRRQIPQLWPRRPVGKLRQHGQHAVPPGDPKPFAGLQDRRDRRDPLSGFLAPNLHPLLALEHDRPHRSLGPVVVDLHPPVPCTAATLQPFRLSHEQFQQPVPTDHGGKSLQTVLTVAPAQ